MSGPLVSASAAFVAKNSRKLPYAIEQSLRFDSGQTGTLTRTPSSNGGSVHTTSAWIKAADPTLMANIFAAYPSESAYGTSGTYDILGWYSEGPYSYIGNGSGNESSLYLGAIDYSYKFRDTSAWYHVIWVSTSNQFQIYVNGVLVASKSRTQNNSYYNQNRPHRISAYRAPNGSLSGYINCYMAEVHFIDGQALDHEDFGEFDDNGVWRPIEYTGSYGTNGYYLKFDPSATNGIGHDHSGNGNNWTPTGFTTSGAYTDVMDDTPTTNWATLNPLTGFRPNGATGRTYSDGNLVEYTPASPGKEHPLITSTQWLRAADGGVYQFEDTVTNSNAYITFAPWMETENAYGSGNAAFFAFYNYDGSGGTVSIGTGYGATGTVQEQGTALSADDVLTTVVDFDNNTIAFYVNGTRNGYITGCNFSDRDIWSPGFAIATSGATATTHTTNFGQQPFQYTPVSGAQPWSTAELDAPDISNPRDHFNVVLYTGNTSTQSITGVGFQPDFVWVKDRTNANSHALFNVISGAGTRLSSDLPSAEITDNTTLTSFDTDGFSLGSDGSGIINRSARNYVAWCWKAGGSGSSNTDGSITSTVSANPTAGFSIVSYTGTGANATVGHGLGVAPGLIIFKDRDAQTRWIVYHQREGNGGYLRLDDTAAFNSDSTVFNTTSPSSTVFSVGTSANTNPDGNDVIAYCFAEVEGYSKFARYAGNGNDDGPFVYCGFRPAFVMLKKSDNTGSWYMFDSARNEYNYVDKMLEANSSSSESGIYIDERIDILSNGFKLRDSNSGLNGSTSKFAFIAFAENPMGGSGVLPATAR